MSALRENLEPRLLHALMGLPERVQGAILRRPVSRDGLTLARETQMMLRLQKVAREPAIEDFPLAQAREALVRQSALVGGRQPIGAIRDLTVDGAEGTVAARLYTPSSRLGPEPVPTLMYFHGGGWVYGDLESHDASLRHLAERSGVQVLAVDYRLAPEHRFPAGLDDCVASFRWLVAHCDDVNADAERLAVGGDSAGGNLAALVALAAARESLPLAFQLLVYPSTDFSRRSESRRLFGRDLFLTDKFMDQCEAWYLGDHDRADPRASVLLTTELPDGLAPAFVITAGFDPLRDEGEAYAALLAEHGVSVEAKRYADMIHGFFNMVGAGRIAPAYNREIAERLRRALA